MVTIMTKIEPELSNLSQTAKQGGKPPAGLTPRPGQIVCGDINMRIDSQGRWHYQGSPINRIELVKLFSTVLKRDDDGDYWLITPVEMCKIEVEDAPFLAVEIIHEGEDQDQNVRFRTNLDQIIPLDDNHPLRIEINENSSEPGPYLALGNGLEAKLTRSVFYELVDLANSEDIGGEHIYGIWSNGDFFAIGPTPEEGDQVYGC